MSEAAESEKTPEPASVNPSGSVSTQPRLKPDLYRKLRLLDHGPTKPPFAAPPNLSNRRRSAMQSCEAFGRRRHSCRRGANVRQPRAFLFYCQLMASDCPLLKFRGLTHQVTEHVAGFVALGEVYPLANDLIFLMSAYSRSSLSIRSGDGAFHPVGSDGMFVILHRCPWSRVSRLIKVSISQLSSNATALTVY